MVLREVRDGAEHEEAPTPHVLIGVDGKEHLLHKQVIVTIGGKQAWVSGLAQGMDCKLTVDAGLVTKVEVA